MAKGYCADHDVGNNKSFIEIAEKIVSDFDIPTVERAIIDHTERNGEPTIIISTEVNIINLLRGKERYSFTLPAMDLATIKNGLIRVLLDEEKPFVIYCNEKDSTRSDRIGVHVFKCCKGCKHNPV